MKTITALLFVAVIGLTIWNIRLRERILTQAPQPQVKVATTVSRYSSRKMEIKPVVHKVGDATENALNKMGLSSNNLVRVIADVVDFQLPPHYDCYLSGKISRNNKSEQVIMSFQLENNSSITRLSVNGMAVPLPEPIQGLPLGDSGLMEDIDLVIWPGAHKDFSNNGDAGNGYIHKDSVLKGGKLIVVMRREGMFISSRGSNIF